MTDDEALAIRPCETLPARVAAMMERLRKHSLEIANLPADLPVGNITPLDAADLLAEVERERVRQSDAADMIAEERDAMERRARSAESDWHTAESRTERMREALIAADDLCTHIKINADTDLERALVAAYDAARAKVEK